MVPDYGMVVWFCLPKALPLVPISLYINTSIFSLDGNYTIPSTNTLYSIYIVHIAHHSAHLDPFSIALHTNTI